MSIYGRYKIKRVCIIRAIGEMHFCSFGISNHICAYAILDFLQGDGNRGGEERLPGRNGWMTESCF